MRDKINVRNIFQFFKYFCHYSSPNAAVLKVRANGESANAGVVGSFHLVHNTSNNVAVFAYEICNIVFYFCERLFRVRRREIGRRAVNTSLDIQIFINILRSGAFQFHFSSVPPDVDCAHERDGVWYFIGMASSFSEPRENVLQLGLREGMKVGDFGAGTGHYARAAAAVVGQSGKVYAIDVQENILKHLKLNSHAHHRNIIDTIWGDIEKPGGTHLREASLDAVILANALFQIENRFSLLKEIQRVLKSGGKLMVIDWAGSYGGMGPVPEKVVTEHEAEALFINGGFHKVKSFRAGPHHYGIIFTAP